MNKPELKGICFGLKPRHPGGKKRVSGIEVAWSDGTSRAIACSEDESGRIVEITEYRKNRRLRDIVGRKEISYDGNGRVSRRFNVVYYPNDLMSSSEQYFLNRMLIKETVVVKGSTRVKWFDPDTGLVSKIRTDFHDAPIGSVQTLFEKYSPPGTLLGIQHWFRRK